MLKKYTSTSELAITVIIKGVSRHIIFEPRTLNGSTYYTSDKEEQKALENHPRFKNFYTVEEVKTEEFVAVPREEDVPMRKITVIEADCLDDAKDYLCERFDDVSRTRLRGVKSIIACAELHNIRFTGPDFNENKEEDEYPKTEE